MKASIIIPTYNESGVILNCINSLHKQSFRDFEIVVVDDGSTDNTFIKLNSLKLSNLKVINQNHQGPGAGRNLGVKHSKGEILVFVDSDMTFDRNFLKMLIKPIISGKALGTFSKDENVSNWENTWARCWNINQSWENRKRHPRRYPDQQPVFRAIKRIEFLKVNGFTPGGYDDDWSLHKKLGYMAQNAPHAIFYHENPSSLKEVFNQAQWVGKRRYKLGFMGYLIALLRVTLPASLLIGFIKSFFHKEPAFVLFKIVYDFGVLVGILKYIFYKKGAK